jgi:hypothetical protein
MSSVFQPPRSGLNNVSEYQASGMPWTSSSVGVTTTPVSYSFPYVTNQLTLRASAGTMRFGFTLNGVNGSNYFLLTTADAPITVDIRVKTLYMRADSGTATASVLAGLTMIDSIQYPTLTGSAAAPDGRAAYITGSYAHEYGYGGLG